MERKDFGKTKNDTPRALDGFDSHRNARKVKLMTVGN